jgi:hypothetical protein
MKMSLGRLVLVAFLAGGGCSPAGSETPPPGGTGGSGGSSSGGRGGSGGSTSAGGSSGSGGSSVAGSGGSGAGGSTGGSAGTTGGSGGSAGGSGGSAGSTGGTPATDGAPADSQTVSDTGTSDTGAATDAPSQGPINVEGAIATWEIPPAGPEVKMDCPGDPTAGFTEYRDTFKVEHPYDLKVADRFNIVDGVITFFVKNGDKKHNPTSTARNPRTEARWSQNFRTGVRMFSADIFWERSVNKGSVVMQVHTTTTGIGPVYMVANGNNVSPIPSGKVPGGLYDRWINLKVEITSSSTGSRYWVNNCLVHTQGSGTRGDGNNYFKLGVYHCDAGTCQSRAKNIKLYMK